ncbi:hypothetical protein GW17_00053304 [Ensete ventricosum]|nr:hypothetical protein GW17_00053304 [Ensete ventricosum]RZS26823.1 hypothetical protein BHM03_00060222 [Ensete ventricosum]
MVKLASARESRTYGHLAARNRLEYINAGFYLLAAVLLVGGFAAELSTAPAFGKSGLAVVLIGLAGVFVVNAHDLVAHLAGVDYCLFLVDFDVQLALVEFAVPLAHIVGTILTFIGILFFLIQGKSWVWLCLSGSCLFSVGGLLNVVKVSKMQRRDGVRLEKLRGSAHESLARRREGQLPLILESSRRKKAEEVRPVV